MREVEIKAHANEYEKTKSIIDSICGVGKPVKKVDTYLINASGQRLRVRNNNGALETTVKKNTNMANGDENNLEFEMDLGHTKEEDAIAFFSVLGYSFHFNKYKTGWDWNYDGVHIELLSVNDLGWFLEMEALIDFDADDELISECRNKLHSLLSRFGLDESDIETKSYKSMILKGDR